MESSLIRKKTRRKSLTRKGLKETFDSGHSGCELEFLRQISDAEFNIVHLKQVKLFWLRVSQSNQFLSSVVLAFIERDDQDPDGLRKFFKVIFMKISCQELFHTCLQKIFNSFLSVLVSENQHSLLEKLLEINMNSYKSDDFNPRIGNLPALVKACMDNNFEITKILVSKGFLLKCDTLSLSTRYLQDKKFRVSYMNLSHISFLHTSDSFNDEIYRLHLARAISRPCYLMACYVTLSLSHKKTEPALKLGAELARSSPSLFSPDYLRNLSNSVASLALDSHSQADPLEKNFQAVPDCRTHAECNDPMFRSLALCRTVKDLSSLSPEYKQEYRRLAADTQQFAINLMAMCKDTAEVDLLLSESAGTSHLLRNSASMKYPRLRLAIELNEKEFVGHMYCQQVLTQQWSGNIFWYRRQPLIKAFFILLQMVLTPLLACCHIIKTCIKDINEACGGNNDFIRALAVRMETVWLFTSLDIPINRCISYFTSILTVIVLLIETVISPIAVSHHRHIEHDLIIRLQDYHCFLAFMMVAIFIREAEDLIAVRSVRIYMNFDFWRIYRSVNYLLIILALLCQFNLHHKVSSQFEEGGCLSDCEVMDHVSFDDVKTELTTTYALYSVATTVSVIQLFYWFQLNDKLGPVVISASQVVLDVFTISSMYVIILVAFSGGIIFIIGTEKVAQSFRVQFLFKANSSRDEEPGYLYNFAKTMEVLFWQSLSPEDPDNKLAEKSLSSLSSTIFTKTLMAVFQTIIILVFMNLLVAVMNATVQKVQDKKELYWMFARSSVWIRFFDDNCALPPPFNLITVIRLLVRFILQLISRRRRKYSSAALSLKKSERQMKYRELMLSLIQRYQEDQKRLDEEGAYCALREMKEEILYELKCLQGRGLSTQTSRVAKLHQYT